MGLFNKMTFWDALQLLDCDYLSPHLKKKIIKAESNFTEEEKTACYIMYSLHKGDCGLALSFINRAEHGEELIPEIMMALFTHVAVRTFRAAYEKEPSNPDYIAFFAFAYEIGFYDCEKDHAKAVEFADLLRFTDADGALVKYVLKKIFPEENHNGSTADDNVRKNAMVNTDPTSTAVPTSAKDPSDKSAPQAEFKRIEYDGGDVYEGETRNGKRHGKGKYTWSDGSFYDGEWKDGKKDGNGKQSHPDGSCYDGGWKDDKMDGFGVLVYSNQSRYEGHWSEGNENGHGMLTFANGNSYDGEWKDGNENGHGIKKYINVGVYDGEWKDGDENGHGIMKYINGDVYDGEWKGGNENGHGTMTYANGDRYDGEWKDGYENGHGTMTYANGDRYDGEWKDGYENDHGMLTFANGNSYDGDWVNGEMNGNGIYTYANGEKYKVTCKEDEIISKEPFETPKTSSTVIRSNQKAKTEYKQIRYDSGDVYEGETQNGKRHGKGKYTWADGDTYEGDWKDGKRCGRGKVIQYGKSPSGETYMKYSYDGEWLDSKEHGHGICVEGDFGWEKMDKVFEGEWVNGKRQGRFVWYFTNSKGGRYIDFYEDGKWIDGCIPYDESIKTVGDAKRFREAEKRTRVSNVKTDFRFAKRLDMDIVASVGYYDGDYMNGERNGYGECAYDNGDKYIGTWKDGAANGVGRYAFARGGFYFGQFLNGRVDGYGVYFDGNDYHIGIFKNGECVTERDLVFEIGSEGKWLPLGFESDKSAQIYGDPNKPSAAIMKSSEGVEYSSTARMWLARFNGNLMVMGKILQKGGPINDQNGVFIHMDGLVATGEIRNSMLNGRVTIRYITGETVEVDCADNKPIEAYHTWDKFGREVW